MQAAVFLIAVLVSGAAVAQAEQELHEQWIELQKLKWALRQQAEQKQRPINRKHTSPTGPPAILYRNNDASLGPYPPGEWFK